MLRRIQLEAWSVSEAAESLTDATPGPEIEKL